LGGPDSLGGADADRAPEPQRHAHKRILFVGKRVKEAASSSGAAAGMVADRARMGMVKCVRSEPALHNCADSPAAHLRR
jgi:hypothetical protein